MIDLGTYTDKALSDLLVEVKMEQERRLLLASAQKTVEDINARVLTAEGIVDGAEWRQPTAAHDAYPVGMKVIREGVEYVNFLPANVTDPVNGVGWRKVTVTGEDAEWVQPVGSLGMYQVGDIVLFNGKKYVSVVANNVWSPADYGWQEKLEEIVLPDPPAPPTPEIAPWRQPTGGHDAYKLGDKVSYDGKIYESTSGANVWAPTVYGWKEIGNA